MLPIRPGLPEKATHDYVRHGTTSLFAALEVASKEATDTCYDRDHPGHRDLHRRLERTQQTLRPDQDRQ